MAASSSTMWSSAVSPVAENRTRTFLLALGAVTDVVAVEHHHDLAAAAGLDVVEQRHGPPPLLLRSRGPDHAARARLYPSTTSRLPWW